MKNLNIYLKNNNIFYQSLESRKNFYRNSKVTSSEKISQIEDYSKIQEKKALEESEKIIGDTFNEFGKIFVNTFDKVGKGLQKVLRERSMQHDA